MCSGRHRPSGASGTPLAGPQQGLLPSQPQSVSAGWMTEWLSRDLASKGSWGQDSV